MDGDSINLFASYLAEKVASSRLTTKRAFSGSELFANLKQQGQNALNAAKPYGQSALDVTKSYLPAAAAGAVAGGGLGYLGGRPKNRLRNVILGALTGAGATSLGQYGLDRWSQNGQPTLGELKGQLASQGAAADAKTPSIFSRFLAGAGNAVHPAIGGAAQELSHQTVDRFGLGPGVVGAAAGAGIGSQWPKLWYPLTTANLSPNSERGFLARRQLSRLSQPELIQDVRRLMNPDGTPVKTPKGVARTVTHPDQVRLNDLKSVIGSTAGMSAAAEQNQVRDRIGGWRYRGAPADASVRETQRLAALRGLSAVTPPEKQIMRGYVTPQGKFQARAFRPGLSGRGAALGGLLGLAAPYVADGAVRSATGGSFLFPNTSQAENMASRLSPEDIQKILAAQQAAN